MAGYIYDPVRGFIPAPNGQGGANQPGYVDPNVLLTSGPRGGGAISVPKIAPGLANLTQAALTPAQSIAPVATPQPVMPTATVAAAPTTPGYDRNAVNSYLQDRIAQQRMPQVTAPTNAAGRQNSFDITNTSRVGADGSVSSTLAQPQTAGINFGFGVNGSETASQYLQRMQGQDRQLAMDNRIQAADLDRAAYVSRLNDARNDPVAYRQLLAQRGLYGGGDQAAAIANTAAGQQLQAAAGIRELQARAQLAAQSNQAEIAGRLQVANLNGQYGLLEASQKAQAARQEQLGKAALPSEQKAAAEASLLQTRLNAINASLQAGVLTPEQAIEATRDGQVAAAKQFVDPITGIPYTPEEIAQAQRKRLQDSQKNTR